MSTQSIRALEYDGGHLADVVSWRVTGSLKSDSLQWRFILPENQTLVVQPIQIKSNERPPCAPHRILPALRAVDWLILLVHERCRIVGGPAAEPDYEALERQAREQVGHAARDVRDAVRARLLEQAQKEDPAAWRDRYDQRRGAKAPVKSAPEGENQKGMRDFICGELVRQHQREHADIWEAAKAEGETESEVLCRLVEEARAELESRRQRFYREVSLYEINEFIGRHAAKSPVPTEKPKAGAFTREERVQVVASLEKCALLVETHDFIRKSCPVPGTPGSSSVHQADCERLVRFLAGRVGNELRASVLKAFHPQMPEWLKEWGREVAEARHVSLQEAGQLLAERLQFVAEFKGRSQSYVAPIENLMPDVHDSADEAPYEIPTADASQTTGCDSGHAIAEGTDADAETLRASDLISQYSIEDRRSHFEIRWASEVLQVKTGVGMKYLAYFLHNPGDTPDARSLYVQVNAKTVPDEKSRDDEDINPDPESGQTATTATTSDKETAKENLKRLSRALRDVKSQLAELENQRDRGEWSSDDEEELDKLIDERAKLVAEVKHWAAVRDGRRLVDKGDEAVKRGTIKRAINKALHRILRDCQTDPAKSVKGSACLEFVKHVRLFLMRDFESEFRYEPDPKLGIIWQ